MDEQFRYDRVAYPSIVFPKIRPAHIGAVAAMHGLPQRDIARSRVLELGCGDGINLLSIAYAMPDVACIGIDLSAERIREAKAVADRVGISNASFRNLDLMDFPVSEYGEFDFIIAHGLFSWVPDFVRDQILSIYAQCLKPNGIGFISYNAYPGWHMRSIIRDAMRFQSETISDPMEKVESSVDFIQFLREAARADDIVYKTFLDAEMKSIANQPRASLFHDDLEDVNQPFYFSDFIATISKHKLKFVSEAEPVAFFDKNLSQAARDALDQLWDEPIRREQLFDFVRCTRFRSTLVCHESAHAHYRPNIESGQQLFLSSKLDPLSEGPVFTDSSVVEFSAQSDAQFTINHPFTKTALRIFSSSRPKQFTFDDLAERVRGVFPKLDETSFNTQKEELRNYVVELIHASFIDVTCFVPAFVNELSAQPHISELARWQAKEGYAYVSGMSGTNTVIANDLVRVLIRLLDGSRNRDQIVNNLLERVSVPPDQLDDFQSALPEMTDKTLQQFACAGLLID